jgi:hypothetical protein
MSALTTVLLTAMTVAGIDGPVDHTNIATGGGQAAVALLHVVAAQALAPPTAARIITIPNAASCTNAVQRIHQNVMS